MFTLPLPVHLSIRPPQPAYFCFPSLCIFRLLRSFPAFLFVHPWKINGLDNIIKLGPPATSWRLLEMLGAERLSGAAAAAALRQRCPTQRLLCWIATHLVAGASDHRTRPDIVNQRAEVSRCATPCSGLPHTRSSGSLTVLATLIGHASQLHCCCRRLCPAAVATAAAGPRCRQAWLARPWWFWVLAAAPVQPVCPAWKSWARMCGRWSGEGLLGTCCTSGGAGAGGVAAGLRHSLLLREGRLPCCCWRVPFLRSLQFLFALRPCRDPAKYADTLGGKKGVEVVAGDVADVQVGCIATWHGRRR